jgi:hypothetical protein
MYGSGSAKPPIEKPGKEARLGQLSAPSDKENMDTNTSSSATVTAAALNPSTRPQAQHDASTASIKSGVLGNGSGEPHMHPETINTAQPSDPFISPITHSKRTKFDDQPLNVERRVDPELTQTKGEEKAAIGQTSTYRSYPLVTGDKTSPLLKIESSHPRIHQQPEKIGAPSSGAGAGLGAIQPGPDNTGTGQVEENTKVPDRAFTGASGVVAREGTPIRPGESTLMQQTKPESNNPYSASRLDPRVDPRAKNLNTRSASAITGAFATSNKEPAGRMHGDYRSSADSRGLSGAKMTAEPFDGPQETSQPLQGPKGTLEPIDNVPKTSQPSRPNSAAQASNETKRSKETSGPPQDEDQCETLVSGMPGAYNYGSIVVASSYHDPVPQEKASYYDFGSSITGPSSKEATPDRQGTVGASDGLEATSRPLKGEDEPFVHKDKAPETRDYDPLPQSEGLSGGFGKSQTTVSTGETPKAAMAGVKSSDTSAHPEDSYKGRKAGFLGAAAGALGLGGHAVKQHAEDKSERPTAGPRRESIPITTYPLGIALGDRRYPELHFGGSAAAPSRPQDRMVVPAEAPTQPSIAKHPSGTGLLVGEKPYPQEREQHFPAAQSRAQGSITAPHTEAASQPATMTYVTNLEQTKATGSMRDPSTTSPAFSGPSKPEESHMARNTTIGSAAAAGASILGAHEYSKYGAEKPSTGIPASTAADRPEDRHHHIDRDTAIASTPTTDTGTHEYSRHQAENLSAGASPSTSLARPEDRHMSRNLAVGGTVAAGSGEVRAHEHSSHQGEKPSTETPHHNIRENPDGSHLGRNAAIGGAAAVGAGAVGAQEYLLRQTEREAQDHLETEKAHQKAVDESRKAAEKEQKAHEKALAKEEKKAEKEHEKVVHKEEKKAEKEHEKAAKKEEREHEKAKHKEEKIAEKEHEKAIKREEKEHEKERVMAVKMEEKQEKEHEKAIKKEEKEYEKKHVVAARMEEKQEKEHEKELAKQERQEEKRRGSEEKDKKKHGLLGLFHHKRDSQDNEVVQAEDDHRDVKTTGDTAATDPAAATAASPEHEKRHILGLPHHEVKNKLHKDPPLGRYSGESATPTHADYAVKQNDHPGAQTAMGGYTAPAPEHDQHKYAAAASTGAGIGAANTGTPSHDPQSPSKLHTGSGTHTRTRPRGSSAAKFADLPDGYASQAKAADTGPAAASHTASSKDINVHSDGRRYYADGTPVDDDAAELDGSPQQQRSEGGKVGKVLEKLHLRKGST